MKLNKLQINGFNILQNVFVIDFNNTSNLSILIGKNGSELWKKANGIDETPVIPFSERKSISKEHTFSKLP